VEEQCRDIPASSLAKSRFAYAMVTSLVLAFFINDVYNSQVDNQTYSVWAYFVAVLIPLLVFVFLKIYFKNPKPNAASAGGKAAGAGTGTGAGDGDGVGKRKGEEVQLELTDIFNANSDTGAAEMHNPISQDSRSGPVAI